MQLRTLPPRASAAALALALALTSIGCATDGADDLEDGTTASALSGHQLDTSGGRYLNEVFTTSQQFSGVVYAPAQATHPALDMNVFTPPSSDRELHRPLVIWIHGGGFTGGDKASLPGWMQQKWTHRGYVIASINYTLLPRDAAGAGQPAQATADVLAAIRWFRAHPTTFRIDPNRIILVGWSAGAFLAYRAAIGSQSAAVQRLNTTNNSQPDWVSFAIAESGRLDEPRNTRSPMDFQNPALYTLHTYRAENLGANDCPNIIGVGGTLDSVPYQDGQADIAALDRAIDYARFVLLPGATHGETNIDPSNPALTQAALGAGNSLIRVVFDRVVRGDPAPAASQAVPQIAW